jgi:hypothetical protein
MSPTPQDDYLHPPADDDRWYTETYWFSLDDPERGLSAQFYPVIRPNLGVAALLVAVYVPGRDAPWTIPYWRPQWHLPVPGFEGDTLSIAGLSYEILEPLNRFRVTYDDPGLFTADLVFEGVADIHVAHPGAVYAGHLDHPCRVTGEIMLGGTRIDLDCFGMRDRSWGPRTDEKRSARASYLYGIAADSGFLVIDLVDRDPPAVLGYLDRDGKRGKIASASIERTDDAMGRIETVRVTAEDEHGRTLETSGIARNHFAMQANPHQFAWMTMVEWDGGKWHGEFQDVWGPDSLSRMNAAALGF